jgi:DDE superfamily endonuclease
MATQRAACHLPRDIDRRPKWQLVLDMLDELAGFKLRPLVLLADSCYGEVGCFRGGLDARQIPYVVEVRAHTSAYPEQVRPTVTSQGAWPPSPAALPPAAVLAHRAGHGGRTALMRGPSLAAWQQGAARRPLPGGAGASGRGYPTPAGTPGRRRAAGALAVGPVATAGARADQVLAVQPAREHPAGGTGRPGQIALASGAGLPRAQRGAGLDHFEGRGWPGWHHHVTLVSVAHGFLTLERLGSPNLVASTVDT